MKHQMQQNHQQKGPQNGSKMEIRNSTAFVPLQAQKKSRDASVQQASKETNAKKSSSPSKTQQQPQKQKQEETLSKVCKSFLFVILTFIIKLSIFCAQKQKPEVVNKAREKITSNSESQIQPKQQLQLQQQPQQNTGKSSKPRKSRVAAKFGTQPLSNGGEPPQ